MRQGLIALVAILTACASASPPPGGPEDKDPPRVLRVTPDTSAVNVHEKYAQFYFDETINDRGTGAQEIDPHFLVSPSDGLPHVEWHRSRIDVSPRHGFKANTAYTITLLPGLADLRNNVMKGGASVVFSTGATIPPYRIKGIIFDWVAERPASQAFIEAVREDSTLFLAQADTLGQFIIGPLTPGSYLVRGYIDANSNRALDRIELFDTVRVNVPQPTAQVELLAAARDTLPVRLLTVSVADSATLKLTFDRPTDPAKPIAATSFRLVKSDSSVIPIVTVLTPLQERQADSVARKLAADSLRRADSVAGKTPTPVAPPTAPAPTVRGAKPPPPPPPKPSRPAPISSVTLKLGTALLPNVDYRLSATGLMSLTSHTAESERRFTTPKPPPVPKDTTAAKPAVKDSTARPPASRPATPPVTPPTRR
ncbi:MAG: Ig-like domain-containing protein [bacterium]